jgi:flagellar hook-length control protein FliK
VRIDIHNEEANIIFSSDHAIVRETVGSALPQLKQMLESQGIQLGHVSVDTVSVAAHLGGRGGQHRTPQEMEDLPKRDRSSESPVILTPELRIRGRGLIDYYI